MTGTRDQAVVDADASMLALWAGDDTGTMVTRTKNALLRLGIYSIGTLTDWTADELLDQRDFGPGQLAEVQRVLTAAGLALKSDGAS